MVVSNFRRDMKIFYWFDKSVLWIRDGLCFAWSKQFIRFERIIHDTFFFFFFAPSWIIVDSRWSEWKRGTIVGRSGRRTDVGAVHCRAIIACLRLSGTIADKGGEKITFGRSIKLPTRRVQRTFNWYGNYGLFVGRRNPREKHFRLIPVLRESLTLRRFDVTTMTFWFRIMRDSQ